MKKLIFLLLFSGVALAQVSTQNKLTFREGETFRPSVTIKGVTATRFELTFRNSIGGQVFKFSTLNNTITQLNDSTFTFAVTDQMSLGKEGRGKWQMEVRSAALGVKKSPEFAYEIYKSTTNAGAGTPVQPSNYDAAVRWDFTPIVPTISLTTDVILLDGQSIAATISDSLDEIRALIAQGGGSSIDTTQYLKKTTAAATYVAKVTGKGLSTVDFTSAYETKLNGIAAGAEVNVNADWNAGSGDAQILNKPSLGTAAGLNVAASGNAASGEVVKGNDTRLSDARTPLTHIHTLSNIAGLQDSLTAKVNTVNLNALIVANSAVVANTAKVTNATHTGDVTGSTTLTYNNVVPANKGGAGSVTGILKANGSGTVSAAVAGTDYGNAATANPLSQFASTTSSQLAGVISDETGTGAAVFGTSPTIVTPTITTSATVPLIIGGTGTTSTMIFRTTSGTGTTGADMIFQNGTNGATEAMRIFHGGNVGIRTGSTNAGYALEVIGTSRVSGNATFSGNVLIGAGLSFYIGGYEIARGGSVHTLGGGASGLEVAHQLGTTSLMKTYSGQIAFGGGQTITTPSASAMVDFQSTTKGVLPPRQTTAQINAISSPVKGLLVFNTDLNTLCFFDGTIWQKYTSTSMN